MVISKPWWGFSVPDQLIQHDCALYPCLYPVITLTLTLGRVVDNGSSFPRTHTGNQDESVGDQDDSVGEVTMMRMLVR